MLPCMGDGRQSGTSDTPSILNASPEAMAGGNLAILKTGDEVKVDLRNRRVDVLLTAEEIGPPPAAVPAAGAAPRFSLAGALSRPRGPARDRSLPGIRRPLSQPQKDRPPPFPLRRDVTHSPCAKTPAGQAETRRDGRILLQSVDNSDNQVWLSACTDAARSTNLERIARMDNQTLTITDNRTKQTYTVPIFRGTIRAMDLRQIKSDPDDFGLMTYDPAFMNTASCQSSITFLDGDKGILRYRGYPIEQLAENCTFLEVAYLLLNGELPTQDQLELWNCEIMRHTMTHENVKKFMDGFHHDAHPMGVLISTVAALSTFYPDSKNRRPQVPPQADRPPHRQNAHFGRLRLSPPSRPALRLPRPRPLLHQELHADALERTEPK